MANSVDPDQTAPIGAPIGAVRSGPTLFASILNLSVMLGIFCSADDIFRCIFFLGTFRANIICKYNKMGV